MLTPQETEQLFVTLRRLRDAGTTLLLITHKLKEIMALCDAVTVMRQRRGGVRRADQRLTPAWTSWPRPWWAAGCKLGRARPATATAHARTPRC